MACTSPKIVVGGVTISTSDFENARELMTRVSGDGGDPTLDEYDENIANGNNDKGRAGVQFPASKQTSLPTSIPDAAAATNDSAPPGLSGSSVVCVPWSGNYSQALSTHFKVKDFTVGALFPNQMQDFPAFLPMQECAICKDLQRTWPSRYWQNLALLASIRDCAMQRLRLRD